MRIFVMPRASFDCIFNALYTQQNSQRAIRIAQHFYMYNGALRKALNFVLFFFKCVFCEMEIVFWLRW